MTPDILTALTPIADAFEALSISYCIGGSVASSTHGLFRATNDIDLIAAMPLTSVKQFVGFLQGHYYVDEVMIREAIQRASSFNVIHLETALKIDIFITKRTPFGQSQLSRVVWMVLPPGQKTFPFASVEDTILAKLDWYKQGGQQSHRQWNDILEMLKKQQRTLDLPYLHQFSTQMHTDDLLQRALDEAK